MAASGVESIMTHRFFDAGALAQGTAPLVTYTATRRAESMAQQAIYECQHPE